MTTVEDDPTEPSPGRRRVWVPLLNGLVHEDQSAACKHGRVECGRCGKRETDTMHTTVGGRGVVGRLRR